MDFNDPLTYAFLSASLVVLSVDAIRPAKLHLLLLLSLAYVALTYHLAARSLVMLAAVVLGHYAALQVMLRCKTIAARATIHYLWLVLAVAGFLVVKQYFWITDLVVDRRFVAVELITVGLSFIFFRQLYLSVEVRDGMLTDVGLLEYVNYNLAFWTFLAGPIQRFDQFREECARFSDRLEAVDGVQVLLGLNRAVFGFIKMFVVGSWVGKFATPGTFLYHPDLLNLTIFCLAFPVYLYFNFSGYCDVVIGLAQAVGFKLPENFNAPYVARNIVDFWSRWHITLSELLRDYLFMPLHTALARRMSVLVAMVIASLLAFLLMGMWHGNTTGFAVFGLMHGFGVVAANLYGQLLKRWLTKDQLKRYRSNVAIRVAAVALCQAYVVLSFLPFHYSWEEIASVGHAVALLASGGAT
jgi:D-alanyl-lipoteichoic acid acyltransferase DltB (MBOAT superfamily)